MMVPNSPDPPDMSTATITPVQQILRWLAVVCALGALALIVVVFQHLMIAAGAATETGLSTLQLLYIFGAGFVLIMGAIAGLAVWMDARNRESEARAEARAREAEARAEARAREAEARTAREFERIYRQLHDIFMILAGNRRGGDSDAERTPKHQAESDGR